MATLVAEAELNRAHLESSAGILGQQQQLEEAARKQVCYTVATQTHSAGAKSLAAAAMAPSCTTLLPTTT